MNTPNPRKEPVKVVAWDGEHGYLEATDARFGIQPIGGWPGTFVPDGCATHRVVPIRKRKVKR